jgi:hypothetical protein
MNKLLYRPKEAAQMLGIGRDKLYDLMRCGVDHRSWCWAGISRSRLSESNRRPVHYE